jgi:hypothetical protein
VRGLGLALTLLFAAAVAAAQAPRRLPFDAGWALSGEGTRVEAWQGASALRMRNGGAIRTDAAFRDGTIEFDLAVSAHRSFVYLRFRLATEGESEELYFRPHKSSLPDAVQYTPAWHGESNWQLYHGASGTAAATFRRNAWMHVRVVIHGRRMAVFLDGAPEPVLLVPLAREPAAGAIAFSTFTPAGGTAPPREPVAAVANVVLRPVPPAYRFPPDSTPRFPAGLVRRWQLSPPFAADSVPVERLADSLLARRTGWPAFEIEPHGVLVIGRHRRRPAEAAAVLARLVIRAERAGLQRLELGFSDYVTVFVDGRPVFAGDAHYSFDRPRQEGLIGLSQATLWLPLPRGDTEILFAVADAFGGWGLTARLDPAGGGRIVSAAP